MPCGVRKGYYSLHMHKTLRVSAYNARWSGRNDKRSGHYESYSSYWMRVNYNVQLPLIVKIFLEVFAYSAFLNGKIIYYRIREYNATRLLGDIF